MEIVKRLIKRDVDSECFLITLLCKTEVALPSVITPAQFPD